MASLLHTVLTAEPNNTALANLTLCSEVKIEACMLLAEVSELTPSYRCEPFQKFKGLLCNLCDYCADVIASGGIPCFTFHFQLVDLTDSELQQFGAAMKSVWLSVPETEILKRFHLYRCMDCATDLCFQLSSRLVWNSAAKVGVRFQHVLGCAAPVQGTKVIIVEHDGQSGQ